MGKRKSSAKPVKKIQQKLSTTFSCLFCNHENSVTCTLEKKTGIGSLTCKVCGQTFQASINALSEPIDVYCEWVDACEAVAKNEGNAANKSTGDDKGRDDYEDETRPANKGVLSDSEDGF